MSNTDTQWIEETKWIENRFVIEFKSTGLKYETDKFDSHSTLIKGTFSLASGNYVVAIETRTASFTNGNWVVPDQLDVTLYPPNGRIIATQGEVHIIQRVGQKVWGRIDVSYPLEDDKKETVTGRFKTTLRVTD
ncbi:MULTISPECIES: hypothetical protein [Pseudomonas]|uniref:Uncharacterized protein n=1 Tax=Pseudomonas taiwanensis TaxID=470150 RepID=A0ABR6V2N3_9PSED|nr:MULTISPECIES: hypothetical protein [Pseudomonas]MBC3474157.1 hypothetical protein [Pseudomonas taiwanensis]MBC3492310.1 hypothetical protein [Pseudomonas taiwanensis]MDT8924067.1 hypothetical protein [Pseudomonas taiwanensis]QQZ34564.1 hypothetical protein IF103_15015 [Pseudomonas sp. SK2]